MSPRAIRRSIARARRREERRRLLPFTIRMRGCNVPVGFRGAARLQAAQQRRLVERPPTAAVQLRRARTRARPRAPRRRGSGARRRDGPGGADGDPDPERHRRHADRTSQEGARGG